ncbi:hypothetical protein D0U04_29135 [Bacillus clarus]|uniref:Uncharacterized protein n=1 Tax=Bacillus clarus TaxID=2338372 RepID=A0ABX9KMN2_9BACI|nr:hypothetical protein D0U04_29135 [Bacillus clarus]
MIIAPLSKRYRRTGKAVRIRKKDEKTNLNLYIQPWGVSVVAFMFLALLIELGKGLAHRWCEILSDKSDT